MLDIAHRLRRVAVLALALAVPFVTAVPLNVRVGLSATAIGYVCASELITRAARRWPAFPAGWLQPLLGIVVLFVATVTVPSVQTAALLLYALVITFHSCLGGLALGLGLAAPVLLATGVAAVLSPNDDRPGALTLMMFAVVVPALALAVEGLMRERRRSGARLARLHDALGAVAIEPDLHSTLESIVTAVRTAVGAEQAGVLLREGDHLAIVAPRQMEPDWSAAEVARFTGLELALGDAGPMGRTILRNAPTVVPDVRHDDRFPEWVRGWGDALAGYGYTTFATVPLRVGDEVIGVINSVYRGRRGLDADDLAVLDAFAERASTVIVRAQAFERERAAAERLTQLDEAKREFLALVAHELRTPLTAAKGFVDTVILHWDRLPEERRRELLRRASGNTDELARLISQLLDFVRTDSSELKLAPKPLRVLDAATDVVRALAPVLSSHRVEAEVDDHLVVKADPDALNHVLVNLLTNAVRYSPVGSCVLVTATARDGVAVISVRDEGAGIAAEEQERIFERFYQGSDQGGARRGTGIGLSIARRFVELSGGRLWVDSEPGRGSTFSLSVPLASVGAVEAAGSPIARDDGSDVALLATDEERGGAA